MSDRQRRVLLALNRARSELTFDQVAERAKLKSGHEAAIVLRELGATSRVAWRCVPDGDGFHHLVWRAV